MYTIKERGIEMARRYFSPDFKHEAASLVVHQGYSINEACEARFYLGTK